MELRECPFCGSNNLGFAQGSTQRWLSVICHDCGAASGEVRKEILCGEFTVGDKQRATEEWNRRASPASVPELTDEQIDRILSTRIPGGSEARDWFLPHELPKGLDNVREVVRLMLSAAPTPPMSEDRKDAERFRDGWTHSCNALCMEIELWVERCPHCGRPAPKVPAMQEDKP